MMASAKMILVVLLCFLLKMKFLQSFSIESNNSQNMSYISEKSIQNVSFGRSFVPLFGQVHVNTHHNIFYWRCRVNLKFNSRWFVGTNKHGSRRCQNNHFMTTVGSSKIVCIFIQRLYSVGHTSTSPQLPGYSYNSAIAAEKLKSIP